MDRLPLPKYDNGRVRIIAPVEINLDKIREIGVQLSRRCQFQMTEEVPHITVISGIRKAGRFAVGPVQFGGELAVFLEQHRVELEALGQAQVRFAKLNQFKREKSSVIYLEPADCKELRAVQAICHEYFRTAADMPEEWKYDPKLWNPHLTVGRIAGSLSEEVLTTAFREEIVGRVSLLLGLLSPYSQRNYYLAA